MHLFPVLCFARKNVYFTACSIALDCFRLTGKCSLQFRPCQCCVQFFKITLSEHYIIPKLLFHGRKPSIPTFRPPFSHIPFLPVIATQKIWQTRGSSFHVKKFLPAIFPRSIERLNPALSMLIRSSLPPFMGLITTWIFQVFPITNKF